MADENEQQETTEVPAQDHEAELQHEAEVVQEAVEEKAKEEEIELPIFPSDIELFPD